MAQQITTSIRMPSDLRLELEQAAHNLHRGKNWIIIQALKNYLGQLQDQKLIQEAKRQSLLACESDKASEQDLWESNYDQSGWE